MKVCFKDWTNITRGIKDFSIRKRLNILIYVCCVPFVIIIAYLLITLNQVSQRYDGVVENIAKANAYNIDFKEDFDYTMYIIVVNSERASKLINMQEPFALINETRNVFEDLYRIAETKEAQNRLSRILKTLNTLEARAQEIVTDAKVSGNYDKNLERLDLNVRILTEIIQEQIQQYIYYETTNLNLIREGIRKDVVNAIHAMLLIFIVVLIGAMIIASHIKNGITKPVQRLYKMTIQAGSGDFDVRVPDTGYNDEIARLSESFNQMVEKIGNLIEDIKIEQLNLQATELKLLQAQINPHFLYNTLDTIIWLAENQQNEEVIMMVTSLSAFFRGSLSKGRDCITIREEEAHVRSYLQIQQFRYRDILEYEIEINEELYQYEILKLTLQPLVENALYHGIKNKRGLGKIKVTGEIVDNHILFKVSDNGMGMKQERLDEVRSMLIKEKKSSDADSGFGLFNVAQRLKLNYGDAYGLTLYSTYGEGTCAEVLIPKIFIPKIEGSVIK